jgi:hypothetical protein
MAAESLERYTHEEARSDEATNIEEVSQAPLKDYQHRETNGDTDIRTYTSDNFVRYRFRASCF